MTARQRIWTVDEVLALGVRTDVPTAGEIIAGLCREEAYRMVKRGDFPVPVVRVGKNRLVVPVEPILRLLRISSPDPGDTDPGARHSETRIHEEGVDVCTGAHTRRAGGPVPAA
jgi:hypothetical protein